MRDAQRGPAADPATAPSRSTLDTGAWNHASISKDALRINFQFGASVAVSAATASVAIRLTDGSSSFVDFAARLKGRNEVA